MMTVCPTPNTCPDINRHIASIRASMLGIIYKAEDLEHDELVDMVKDMDSMLHECIDFAEEMRIANSSIRGWGEEQATLLIDAQRDIINLEDKVNELESELSKACRKMSLI